VISRARALGRLIVPPPFHPLFIWTLALCAGIIWGWAGASCALPSTLCALAFITLWYHPPTNHLWYLLLIGAGTFFFVGNARYHHQVAAFDSFYHATAYGTWTATGTVTDIEPNYKQEGTIIVTLKLASLNGRFGALESSLGQHVAIVLRTQPEAPELTDSARSNPSTALPPSRLEPLWRTGRTSGERGERGTGQAGNKTNAPLKKTRKKKRKAWEEEPDSLSVQLEQQMRLQRINSLQVGDLVQCSPLFFRYPNNSSYRLFLIKEKSLGTLWAPNANIYVLHSPSWSCARSLARWRNDTLAKIKTQLSSKSFTFYSSVFLGKHSVSSTDMSDIRDHFRPWGILHHLARSGLHLVLILIIWSWLLQFIPLPFFIRELIMAIIIAAYMLFSWSSVSFVRACTTFFLYKACTLQTLPVHTLYLFFLTAFLVLLVNPLQLFFLDFQLSFSLTLVLAWLQVLKRKTKASA